MRLDDNSRFNLLEERVKELEATDPFRQAIIAGAEGSNKAQQELVEKYEATKLSETGGNCPTGLRMFGGTGGAAKVKPSLREEIKNALLESMVVYNYSDVQDALDEDKFVGLVAELVANRLEKMQQYKPGDLIGYIHADEVRALINELRKEK